jgi:hypothetical protein
VTSPLGYELLFVSFGRFLGAIVGSQRCGCRYCLLLQLRLNDAPGKHSEYVKY